MIPNYWYAIIESKKVKQKPVSIKRMAEDLVLWRAVNGNVICMVDRCPHRGAALSLGKIKDNCIECPYHGFQYNTDGQCTLMPCMGKNAVIPPGFVVKSFPTREAQGFIWIWWGKERSLKPKYAGLNSNKLVAADTGSAHYLKRYEQFMRQATEQNKKEIDRD